MSKQYTNIELIRIWGIRILGVASILEAICFPKLENIYGCFVSIYAWCLLSSVVLLKRNFEKSLLPTCAVLGYVVCYYVLPLIVTLIERKPLTYNFQVPFLMFTNQIINVTVIIIAYFFCIIIYDQKCILTRIWKHIGYFNKPTEFSIWSLGIMGMTCLFFNIGRQTENVEIQATSTIIDQFINFIQGFSVFPLCLYFPQLLGRNESFISKRYVFLYIIVLSIIGIATTSIALVFNSLATIGIIFILLVIIDNKKILTLKSFTIGCIAFFLISGPFTDIATAMILNRHNISDGTTTFNDVIELYNDKEELHRVYNYAMNQKDNGGNNELGWSEYYVDNIFLDRFCNIRVQDATLYYTEKLGYANGIMQQYFYKNIINHLPGFVVEMLDEKKSVITTPIDHMVGWRWSGASIGSWRVGGDTGIGLATMGYWYYPFAFCAYFLLFFFLSSCVFKCSNGLYIIPLPILATMMWYFTYFDNATGIYRTINLLLSSGWRNIIVYCAIILVFNTLFSFFKK